MMFIIGHYVYTANEYTKTYKKTYMILVSLIEQPLTLRDVYKVKYLNNFIIDYVLKYGSTKWFLPNIINKNQKLQVNIYKLLVDTYHSKFSFFETFIISKNYDTLYTILDSFYPWNGQLLLLFELLDLDDLQQKDFLLKILSMYKNVTGDKFSYHLNKVFTELGNNTNLIDDMIRIGILDKNNINLFLNKIRNTDSKVYRKLIYALNNM